MKTLVAEISGSDLLRSKGGWRHVLAHPAVTAIVKDERLLQTAESILGPRAFPFRATLFDKSPGSNWLVSWRQDTALPLKAKREVGGWGPWSIKDGIHYAHAPASALESVIAIRIHIDDSTHANGPLRVLPGTHIRGILSVEQARELSTKIEPFQCVVRSGGLLLMRPLIVHASSKSQSEEPRRVLHVEYTSRREFDGLELQEA